MPDCTGLERLDRQLTPQEIEKALTEGLREPVYDGSRVLVIIPDGTRTAPIPLCFRQLCEQLLPRVKTLDFIVALGTHPAMSEAALLDHVGITAEERCTTYAEVGLFNHVWGDPDALVTLATLAPAEVRSLSEGRLSQSLPVTINRCVLDYDVLLICGPVYPHEVAGFSGGNKYFFPGISGPDAINLTHWLGAILTNYSIIGTLHTPVRAMIDRAAQAIPRLRRCVAMVVRGRGLAGIYTGTPEVAWEQAARLSSRIHITWVDRPFKQALAMVPPMYKDLWTGAKGVYKLEPVMADDSELILYAPHISELSYTHGHILDQIGYHGSSFYLARWNEYKHLPWAVLAHSSHVRGQSTYSSGTERARIRVTLASQVSRSRCSRLGLGYRDPDSIDLNQWKGRQSEGVLFVERAGERLYRLKP